MADWSKPALASTYADFVTETNGRDTDLAVMFDPAVTTPTSFPTNAIRWRAAANKWEKWNGTVWGDLATTYAINISGNAGNVTGVVAAANGGTDQSSYTIGDLLYASAAAALSKLAAVATGNVLLSGGAATAPTWGKVGLTTHVSGILPIANGGTGSSTGIFPSGTRMPFAQASAPTGWVQDTSDNANNRMLRVVNTTGGTVGGSHSPVLNNVVPAHTHNMTTGADSNNHTHTGTTGTESADHTHGLSIAIGYGPRRADNSSGAGVGTENGVFSYSTGGRSAAHTHAFTTNGISTTHNHSGTTDNGSSQTNWTPRYIDMIICSKA